MTTRLYRRFPLLFMLAFSTAAPAAERAGLLIGNHNYTAANSFRPIPAAVADVAAMKASLLATGFAAPDVRVFNDLTSKQMRDAVTTFAAAYKGTPEVLVYISSHGLSVGTQNFLAGVDTDMDPGEKLTALQTLYGRETARYASEKLRLTGELLDDRCCPLGFVIKALEEMSDDPTHCKIIILDACRNELEDIENYLSKAPLLKGLPTGLAPVEPPSGMFIGFAAKAGQFSIANEDGTTGTPSLFTGVFAKRIRQPGTLDEIFRDVRNVVEPASLEIARRHPALNITRQSPFPYEDLRRSFEFVKAIGVRRVPERPSTKERKGEVPLADGSPAGATKDAPFINSLGMEFVPVKAVPGLLFCRWETRVRDYEAFRGKTGRSHEKPNFAQGDDHPVVNVTFQDAQAFCAWLSKKEGRTYRLPTDAEWSGAVGIGTEENPAASPESKDGRIKNLYPWGNAWPPPAGSGNFASSLKVDAFENTSTVGIFLASEDGLYDLAGNVREWCDTIGEPTPGLKLQVLRGGSRGSDDSLVLRSAVRNYAHPAFRHVNYGFRVVLGVGGGG